MGDPGPTPTSEALSTAPPGGRVRIVTLLMGCVFLVHFNRISISVAGAEAIIPQENIDPTAMGWVYSAYLFLYTLCMTPGGWLIDRYGPKAALLLVCFGSAVFVSLTGVIGLLVAGPALVSALFLIRCALGVVNAPIHPGSARMVSHWVPATGQGVCNGLAVGAACLGIASTYQIFGRLIDQFGWPGAFLVSGCVTILMGATWLLLAADYPPDESREAPRQVESNGAPHTFGPTLALLKNSSLLFLTLSYAAVGYFQYLFFYWMQYYFETVRGLDKETGRWYATVCTLAMGFGMFAGGWLMDVAVVRLGLRWGRRAVPIGGLLLAAVMLLLGLAGNDMTVTLVCFCVSMAGVGASEAAYWTTAVDLGGPYGGTAAAILNTGGNAGGLPAPIITPWLSEVFGWDAAIRVACLIALLGAACWWAVEPPAKPKEVRSDPL